MSGKLLNLFFFLLIAGGLSAQDLAATPESPTGATDACEKVEVPFSMRNVSNGDISAFWRLDRIDVPEEWTITICDAVNCYAEGVITITDPDKANNFTAGQSIDIYSLKVDPHDVEGIGDFDFVMYNMDDNTEIYTNTPIVVTVENCASAVHDIKVVENINVYPNPTTEMFRITNNEIVTSVVIYNIIGKEVKSFDKSLTGIYNVSDLTNGMYLVRMFDEDGDMIKVSRLSKR